MPIPIKYVYEGDKDRARNFRRLAQIGLDTLQKDMEFQGLTQYRRRIEYTDGTIIKLEINYNLPVAIISCPFIEDEKELKGIKETTYLNSTGGKLKQGSAFGNLPPIETCNKQGANASTALCVGAVKPFQPIEIVSATVLNYDPDYVDSFQVRGGVPPYEWRISGSDYYFKDVDGNHVTTTPGVLEPPICVGGKYHGYLGGMGGITGMLYALAGGTVINKDVCERGGGSYLYLGHVVLFAASECDARLSIKDVCENTGYKELKFLPMTWDPASADVITAGQNADVAILHDGKAQYTWLIVEGDGFWFDAEHTLKEVVTDSKGMRLYTEVTACKATIKVITCAEVCTGTVRTNTGNWVAVCNATNWGTRVYPCDHIWAPNPDYDIINGFQKWHMKGADSGMTTYCCFSWINSRWSPPD